MFRIQNSGFNSDVQHPFKRQILNVCVTLKNEFESYVTPKNEFETIILCACVCCLEVTYLMQQLFNQLAEYL